MRARTAAVAVATLALSALGAPTPAHADPYVVDHCRHFAPDAPFVRIDRVQTLYAADAPSSEALLGFYANHAAEPIRTDVAPVTVPADVPLPAGTRSLQWRLTYPFASASSKTALVRVR